MNIIDKILLEAEINVKGFQDQLPEKYAFLYRDVTKFIHPTDKFAAVKEFDKFLRGGSKPDYHINPAMLVMSSGSYGKGVPSVIKLNNVYYAVQGFEGFEPNRYHNPNDKIEVRLLNCDDIKIGQTTQSNFDF